METKISQKSKIKNNIQQVINILLGISLILFPILFYTGFTDPVISKQVLLGSVTCITIFLMGIQYIKGLFEESSHIVMLKQVQDDRQKVLLPLVIFILVLLISALFSLHKADALINWSWYFFAVVFSWIIILQKKSFASIFFIRCLLTGIFLASILHILAFFSIFPLGGQLKIFTPLDSLIDHMVILIAILPLATSFKKYWVIGLLVYLVIGLSLLLSLYEIFFIAKPLILPAFMGLHIATNEILHDSSRQIISFLFGSGIGTFTTDFIRFKPVEINFDPTLWNVNFVNSSSFFLELLATTGIIGAASYIFIGVWIVKMIFSTSPQSSPRGEEARSAGEVENSGFYYALGAFLIFLASVFLPVSYTTIVIMFVMIGLSVSFQRTENRSVQSVFRYLYSVVCLLSSAILGFYLFSYSYADILFEQSLHVNNIKQTYQKQLQAIKLFPYRDIFYRSFSQTSLSIGKTISLKVSQNDGLALFQEAISSAKTATNLSPLSAANWQNLAAIYRSLNIKGADAYAITSTQQALLLDPDNPQEYMNLGGTYYQLALWDDAIKQFSSAIRLKPDFPNAYYNRGHAYEQKGDFTKALKDYQKASDLVANFPQAKMKIDNEINTLQNKMGK